MSSNGFIKLTRSEITEELLEHHPNAFLLLTLISMRAKREPTLKLKVGESYIGDFTKCGLTRQKYRTALENLVELKLITIKATKSGTIATICGAVVYDCNIDNSNQQVNQKITTEQPQNNHRITTEQPLIRSKEIEEVKKEERNILCDDFLIHWNSISGIAKRSFRTSGTKLKVYDKIRSRLKSFKHEDVQKFFVSLAKTEYNFKESWFTLDWCVKNDENFEKVINEWMAFKKAKKEEDRPFYACLHDGEFKL